MAVVSNYKLDVCTEKSSLFIVLKIVIVPVHEISCLYIFDGDCLYMLVVLYLLYKVCVYVYR